MPLVYLPRRLQALTGAQNPVPVPGDTVRQVIEALEARFPGVQARLCDVGGQALAPGMAVAVDGVTSELGLLERVEAHSEVHFLPAIAGGAGPAEAGRGALVERC